MSPFSTQLNHYHPLGQKWMGRAKLLVDVISWISLRTREISFNELHMKKTQKKRLSLHDSALSALTALSVLVPADDIQAKQIHPKLRWTIQLMVPWVSNMSPARPSIKVYTQTLHVWYIYRPIGVVLGVNVGIYGSPMECLGYTIPSIPHTRRVWDCLPGLPRNGPTWLKGGRFGAAVLWQSQTGRVWLYLNISSRQRRNTHPYTPWDCHICLH